MNPPEEVRDALRSLRRRGVRRWGSRRAAVAVIVVVGADGPAVLLTRRTGTISNSFGPNSVGQLALPGGWINRGESASAAARRQLADELGMRLPPESVLGLLDDYVTAARIVITPVVLWAGEHAQLCRHATTEVLAIPFTELDVEPVFVATSDADRPVIRLPLHGGWLLAPTAAVLHQFREVVIHRRRTRVAAS